MIVVDVNKFDARHFALAGFPLDQVTRSPLLGPSVQDSCSVMQQHGLWDTQNSMAWIKIAFKTDDDPDVTLANIAAPKELLEQASVVVAVWSVEFQKILKIKTTTYCLPRSLRTGLYRRFKFDAKQSPPTNFDFV